MTTAKNQTLTTTLTRIVMLLVAFQGVIPLMPIDNLGTVTLVSAIVMFLVSVLTAIKQYVGIDISNNALTPTLIILALAILGAANEFLDVVYIAESWQQWIRFFVTLLAAFFNITSKMMYPNELTTSKL